MNSLSGDHPIRGFFLQTLHESLSERLGLGSEDVEQYLTGMLVSFLHHDSIFSVRDATGRSVTSIAEMLVEGDVRLNANSFDREREVHRHVGDLLLFWSGLFPEYLRIIKSPTSKDALLDPVGQGKMSYHVASTFDHGAYGEEAAVLRKLSRDFEAYQFGLSLVRAQFDGWPGSNWADGFRA